MINLSKEQISEYYYRSYTSVDGLWFLKVEKKYDFDSAFSIDKEVWRVVPKIQARVLKSMCKTEDIMDSLLECFSTKLALDRFEFETERDDEDKEIKIIIKICPWHNLIVKTNREKLFEKIGGEICKIEFSVFALEFDKNIKFEQGETICNGGKNCILKFRY